MNPVREDQACESSNISNTALVALMDNNNTTTRSLTNHVSVALSLPYEMIEAILVNFTAPGLLLAAAHLPKLWQDVTGTSREIWRNIARYHSYGGDHAVTQNRSRKRPLSGFEGRYRGGVVSTRCILLGGQLFIHHDAFGNDGFIFAPGREELPLVILNSKTSVLKHSQGPRTAKWSIELYGLDGKLVWNQDLRCDSNIVMGRYLRVVYEDHLLELDRRAKRRKRGSM